MSRYKFIAYHHTGWAAWEDGPLHKFANEVKNAF